MDAKIATIHSRLGGGPARNNVVCRYWMMGKCNRNPCRFMHRELPPPNVYRRTSEQPNLLRKEQSIRSPSHGLKNSLALSDGSEVKTAQNSTNHVIKDPPRKRPNPGNSLASNSGGGGGGSEYKCTRESSSSGTKAMNLEKIKPSSNSSVLVVEGNASEEKTVECSKKACENWMSDKCDKEDGCQFLHSWFYGDWFSTLAKLKGHIQAVSGIALPSRSDKLFSSGSDGTVHVWDCNTGQSTRVINVGVKIGAWNIETAAEFNLDGPVGQVNAIAVADVVDMLFAGAQDGAILAWKGSAKNPNPFELASSMKGHTSAVICLTIGRNRLYSGSVDNTIRAWDLDTLQCVHTLSGHNDAVTSLICWDQYLLSCSLDKTIKAWAFTEEGNLDVIYTHNEEHGAIALCGMPDAEAKPILLCSCSDNTVYLYELPTFIERGRIFSKSEVRTIQTGPGEIVELRGPDPSFCDGAKTVLKESDEEPGVENEKAESAALPPSEGVPETTGKEEPAADGHDAVNTQQASVEDLNTDDAEKKEESEKHSEEDEDPVTDTQTASRKMEVPNDKVGLIIGRGGDAIKALQAKSGARIQLIPQHLPEGDGSKERTVRVTGDRKQIEMAREMIKDVMNQHLVIHGFTLISGISLNILLLKELIWHKSDQLSGACLTMMLDCEVITLLWQFQPTAFLSTTYWSIKLGSTRPSFITAKSLRLSSPRTLSFSKFTVSTSKLWWLSSPTNGPRGNFGSGWEQRPPTMQGPVPHGGVYDYGVQGGHVSDHPASGPISTPVSGHAPSPSPTPAMSHSPSQANYNYGQPHGPDYGHQAPYSQAVPSQQGYGHGYDETKYDNHAPMQHPYGHGSSQPVYPQASNQPGYRAQQQYGKQPSCGMPLQGPPPNHVALLGLVNLVICHIKVLRGTIRQCLLLAPAIHSKVASSMLSQPGGQQSTGYVQGPTSGYGSYPSSQQCYPEQPASNNAGYGYQGSQDPAYGSGPGATYSAPPSGQQAYAQPTATQPSYDQSVPQSGAYGAAPGSAPVGYGKNLVSLAHLPSI
ncbi:hypothetical protein GH714_013015 [Hevea brasiliensis]|uniref:C3H1-type domain-containing protein n=1 Tax=Hevea brasiliensis TaxID=3981 RepID=A0A6A6KR60_HEVBR|nr:hypothetical protein GH714_013015 [Hevea brasiliensis]